MAETITVMPHRLALAALLTVSAAACTVKDPKFCDSTHPCSDPSAPYCDLTGAYDQPDHLKNSCVASPFDAMPEGPMPDAAPATAKLEIDHDTYDFHDVQMGADSFAMQFIVTNTGDLPSGAINLSIGGTNQASFIIVPTGDSSDCKDKMLAAHDTCIVQVKYHAGAAGPESGVLHVDASPGGMPIVGLSGNSLAPGALEVTAGDPLDFGSTAIQSTTASQTITVHNKGGIACTNVMIVVNDPTDFTKVSTTCGTSISPNVSCDVNVQFNPTTVGTHGSSIKIASDQGSVAPQVTGVGTANVIVNKVGTGSVADTLGTPIISCGSTCTGTYSTTPITLHATTTGGIPFDTWGGACASAGANADCTLSLTSPSSTVSATFGVCKPGTGMCASGMLQTCDSTGHWSAPSTCTLGCFTDNTRCWDVAPSNGLAAALDDARTQPSYMLMSGATFDKNGNVIDGNGSVVTMKSTTVSGLRVYEVGSLTLSSTTVTALSNQSGMIAIVSDGDISINGVVNVAPATYAGNACGTDAGDGLGGSGGGHTPGAGGGTWGSAGARGGNNPPNNGWGGGVPGFATVSPLTPSCDGGVIIGSNLAWGGAGGGAIQLVSRTTIKVTGGGVISVGGGGAPAQNGAAGANTLGGGGGGPGGSILLEAPFVVLNGASAGLAVNGGGGSANCTTGAGQNGKPSTAVALGGQCTGSTITNGGNGAAGATTATQGIDFTTGINGNAGGGGGGLGVLVIHTITNGFSQVNGAFTSGALSTGAIGTR